MNQVESHQGKYLILSIDSGALRGLFAIRLLRRLRASYPGFLENVHLVAGTSTGGVIALAIAAGIDIDRLEKLYLDASHVLFRTTVVGKLDNMWGRLTGCPYASANRRIPFEEDFKQTHCAYLRDLKKKVIIPAVRLKPTTSPTPSTTCSDDITSQTDHQWDAQFFHNFMHSPDNDGGETVMDVAMRTTAAPTYYPVYQGYVDGGVVCCNPSVPAIAQAMDPVRGAGVSLSQIYVLSIGLGHARDAVEEAKEKELHWGVFEWLESDLLTTMMLEGVAGVNHYIAQQLLGERGYRRIDFKLPVNVEADDHGPKFLDFLLRKADQVADSIIAGHQSCYPSVGEWIQKNFCHPQ